MPKQSDPGTEDLPADNGARLAIFDAFDEAARGGPNRAGLSAEDLHDKVIGRLRILVPQELHLLGEREYLTSKLRTCIEAGVIQGSPVAPDRLVLGETVPRVRYPDGILRGYTPGLEAARERLHRDESRLRLTGFNVRHIVKPASARRKSESFRHLVASMREHGFLEQFPLTESPSAGIIDGLARQAAAAEAGIAINPKRHCIKLKRRDTLLHHALLVLDVNAARLTEEEVASVHQTIADRVQRPWIEVAHDLDLTRDWRRAEPKSYDVKFEVELLPYRGQEEPKVQVTTDRSRVMLRSLMLEAGVPEYQRDLLKPYVATEEARTQFSGRKAIFVDIGSAIDGIGRMVRTRTRQNLKTEPAWEEMRSWLRQSFCGPDELSAPPNS